MSNKQNSSWIDQFINCYSISKTLRFELRPIGKTAENIKVFLKNHDECGCDEERNKSDRVRAEKYAKAKKLIDEYHKDFIEKVLDGKKLDWSELKEAYEDEQKNKTTENFTDLGKKQKTFRKEIVKWFKDYSKNGQKLFEKLFNKELFKDKGKDSELFNFCKECKKFTPEEKKEAEDLIETFKEFTTYFKGFNENRKNLYSEEEASTAIAYRIVHENFRYFLNNLRAFEKIQREAPVIIEKAEKNLVDKLRGFGLDSLTEVFKLEFFNKVLSQKGIDFYNLILGGYTEKTALAKRKSRE